MLLLYFVSVGHVHTCSSPVCRFHLLTTFVVNKRIITDTVRRKGIIPQHYTTIQYAQMHIINKNLVHSAP